MTEAQLLAEVTALCDHLGLLWHHDPDSRRSKGTRGFPDLVILGGAELIFVELKSDDGDVSADQQRWAWHLGNAGADCRLWQPRHWDSGIIRQQLKTLA